MAWYEVILLILVFGGFSVFAFYTEIKRVREHTRTEKAKRQFMHDSLIYLQSISISLECLANKN